MQISIMQMLVWPFQLRPLKLHVVLEVRKLLYLNNTAVTRHVFADNFRFLPCIIIDSHFYFTNNALSYTNLEVKIYVV